MRKHLLLCAVGVLAVGALGGSAIAGQDSTTDAKNKFPKDSDARDCDAPMNVGDVAVDPGNDQIVFHGATTLWPPNHKYRTVSITADGDSADENTSLTTSVVSDQPANGIGDGNTENDASPANATAADADDGQADGDATTEHQLRAERAGPIKAGRTYEITATASFDNGADSCTEIFVVHVPHDMGRSGN